MSEQFDTYYHWFGIRPNDQPPNHYRLLGIDLFEDGLVVIDEAFHRRQDYLLDHVDGPHGSDAKKIMDELSVARDCLSNPISKLAYDADLLLGPEQEAERMASHGEPRALPIPPPVSQEAIEASDDESSKNKPPDPPPVKDEPPIAVGAIGERVSSESTSPPKIQKPVAHAMHHRIAPRRLAVVAAMIALAAVVVATVVVWPTRDRDRSPVVKTAETAEPTVPKSRTADSSSGSDSSQRGDAVNQFEGTESVDNGSTSEVLEKGDVAVEEQRETAAEPPGNDSAPFDVVPGASETGTHLPVREGLILWLDASKFDSLQLDDNKRVERWNDSSGNNNLAAQPASEKRPIFVASSAETHGRIRFDGEQSIEVENGEGFNFGDNYSFVFVAQGEEGVLADKGDGYKAGAFSFWNGVATFRTHNKMLKAGDPSPATLKVRAVVADNSAVRWFVGDELTGVYERDHTIDNDQPFVIGARSKSSDPRYFVGEICELLVFERALSDDEYGQLENYLSGKWLSGAATRVVARKPFTGPVGRDTTEPTSSESGNITGAKSPPASFKPPTFTGEIFRDIWRDCRGNTVEDVLSVIKERPEPDETVRIESLETPEDFADNYAQRLRGYLHPPQTGEYSFKIRANAEGAIFLSTDTDPGNKRHIEPDQTVHLTAGEVYYVEALHKESTGRDYFQVGWKLPSGTEEFPVPGNRISVQPRLIPPHETGFVLLKPIRATASGESKLELLKDGRVLASGPVGEGEIFDVVFETDIPTITGLRLEPVQHDSLPANGPGFGPAGRFMLAEVAVSLRPKSAAADETSVAIGRVISEDSGARRLIDGDKKTKWLVRRGTRPASATLVPSEPVVVGQQKLLAVQLLNGEAIGCFRMMATSSPTPDRIERSDLAPADADSKDAVVLFVNVGGRNFADKDGKTWLASRTFDGESYGHEGGTSVTDDDAENPLAGSAQRGILAFRAIVPNGAYEVGLYFCEYWTDDSSRRVFSVAVERKTMLRNFNLLRAAGGQGRPFIFPVRKVIVKDERLDVDFKTVGPGASAILNAISIRKLR